MSRFRKLSQTIWHCQYHIMWTPKYRYRILTDQLGLDVDSCIRAFSDQLKCEIVELNVQIDHVHLLVMVPPKISISDYVGTVKGRTAIRVLNKFSISLGPCRRHKTSVVKRCMISKYYRNSEP